MALFTVADVGAAVGKTYTVGTAEYSQCQFFVDTVTAYITEMIGWAFEETEFSARLQADYDGVIVIPYRPVVSVDSILTIEGATRTGWDFDGISEIDFLEAHEVVDVTYTAGSDVVPAALKQLAISVAARQAVNPEGIRQQTVGAISETWAAGDGMAGSVFFTPMEKSILSNYTDNDGTLRLGPRDTRWRTTLPIL